MKILGDRAREWVGRVFPSLKKEHPVPGFLNAIADAFVSDEGERGDFVLDAMKGMQARLETMAEAARIRDMRARVADGGEITLEEQTEMQALQAEKKGELERLTPTEGEPREVSPSDFGAARNAFQYLEAAYEILGWGEVSADQYLSPIANAALETASRAAIEGKEQHGANQEALSNILRGAQGTGYVLNASSLRLAATARRIYLKDEPAATEVADPRLNWRQPAVDRNAALEALADLTPAALRTALANTKLDPPPTAAEKQTAVSSCCSRTGWSASSLRTVLNDNNPYAAPSGHRILAGLKDAVALAAEFDVELTGHDFKDLAMYEAQLTVLTSQLPDPAAEGCPVPSRADVVAALAQVTVRDLRGAMSSVKLDPPLSDAETQELVGEVMNKQLERFLPGLEEQIEPLRGHVSEVQGLIDAGEKDPMAARRGPGERAESSLRVLTITREFGASHGVDPDPALAESHDKAEAAVTALLAESQAVLEAFRASVKDAS